jgi:chemotaxis protein histidine kinase CheA
VTDTFNRYNSDGKLFYIINKTLPSSDPTYKIALSKKFEGNQDFYDALDNSIKGSSILETDEIKKILQKINEYMGVEYAGQLKIYSDEQEKKKEQERLRNLEARRIRNAKNEEADERRINGEWDLTNNIDDIGLKAWALFEYLEGQGANVKTKEDFERAREIGLEVERLTQEYDNSEDVRTDLLDEISDLEDELQEINDKMDVYMLLPESYDHYDMTRFEVIGDDFYGQSFAVGDSDEVETSAVEYVEGLIDDIGYEGFNSSFWKSHLDEDAIVSHAEDVYNEDLYDNPDSYFDDEDRMLDNVQLDQIRNLKSKINSLVKTQNQLREIQNGLDDTSDERNDEIEEKIESIEETIEELKDEIVDIEDNPQGDFPQEVIDEKLQTLLNDVKRDPEAYLENYGLLAENFIDKDSFVQGVIDSDGYGMLSSYDGSYDISKVRGTDYYVMRID